MNIGRLIISDPFARFLSDLFHLLPQASGVPMQIARWPIAPEGFKRCTMAGWWDIQTHLEEKIMAILQRILGSGWTMKHLGFQASLKKGTDFIVSCWRFLCWYHGAPNCSEERCEGQVPYKSWEATWRVINQTWWLNVVKHDFVWKRQVYDKLIPMNRVESRPFQHKTNPFPSSYFVSQASSTMYAWYDGCGDH